MKKKKKIKLILSLIVFCLSIPFLIYFFTPDTNLYHPNEIIYTNENDDTILSTIQNKEGKYVKIDEINKNFIKYLIQIEDRNFYTHDGFDILRIISSIFNNIKGNSLQGASTITMQLARILYLSQEQSIERKIQELAIALKLEKKFNKNQILEFYLNNVYFAHGIYGIGTATNYYFGKDPLNLTIKESAILIGIINAPNIYSPYIDLEASNKKASSILRILHDYDLISIKEYYDALFEEINLKPHNEEMIYSFPYYIDSINEELKRLNISSINLTHGIEVVSYLDIKIQTFIESLIKNINFENSNTAVCIMEANSGKVVSLVGGKNYLESSFNRALHAKKQIGSTIKPLLYYLALKKGLTPLSEFTSEKTTFKLNDDEYYEVSNANEVYANRKITMVEALAMSDNIYAMKTMLLVKKENLINLINSFGFDVDVNNVTLALGSNTLSPLELTSIYNTIASGGIYYYPRFIKNIKLDELSDIYHNSMPSKRILHQDTNSILQYLLRAPFDESLKSYSTPSLMSYYVSKSYGGKTGSTDNSSWVMGFSNKYTIGVYVGSDDNSAINNSYLSRVIFYEIASFLDNKNEGYFSVPSSLKTFKLYNTLTNKHSFTYLY